VNLSAKEVMVDLKGWSHWRPPPESHEILEILERYCETPQVSDEAKQMLEKKGCKVLGYNCSILVLRL
jgi:hypothetical protein